MLSVCISKAYQRYQLFHTDRAWCIPQCLDVEAMREAASTLFLGEKDYSTVRNSGCQSPTPFRNVLAIDVQSSSGNFATTSIYNGNTYNLLMARACTFYLSYKSITTLSIGRGKDVLSYNNYHG